jgi:dihydrofolate reductase
MEDLLNLHDSIKAAAYLGNVKNTYVSAQRLKTQDIMVIMGRRVYERVKTWTENRLMPFLKIIAD